MPKARKGGENVANKNSNYPNAVPPKVTGEEMAMQVLATEELRELPQIIYTSPTELENRIKYYFDWCVKYQMRPSVELMALCIGVSRVSLWKWEQEGGSRGEIIQRAKQVLAALTEQWGITGKMNPAAFCFIMKNHFGYSDDYRLEAVPTNKLNALPTKEEITKRIPTGPIGLKSDPDIDGLLGELEGE